MKIQTFLLIIALIFAGSCVTKAPTAASANSATSQVWVSRDEPIANAAANINEGNALTEGKVLFENNCSNCHKLYNPTDFSKEEWSVILVSMQKQANLDDVEMAKISGYIKTQL